jgi:UDP-glucose:(heptosyl)LPS alpha-1,3-glucosyltransferase
MKLAFCLFKYFPFGGLQRDFLRIAETCRQRGHRIDVFAWSWQGKVPEGFNLQLLPARGWSNHRRSRAFARDLETRLRTGGYDAVIGFNKLPGLDVYFAADPCFAAKARQKHGPLYRLGSRYKTYAGLENAVFDPEAATEILLISEVEKPNFIRCYGTAEERFHFLPPGIARDRRAPDNAAEVRREFRREFGFGDQARLLLMVGSGYQTKGLDRSLRALAALPEELRAHTFLLVVGQGKGVSFTRLARKLGVEAQLRLYGGREDVPRFLLAADLLLQPSYYENTGTAIVEAIAAGLPVLATANCGYAHFVEESGAGKLVPVPFEQQVMNALLLEMLTAPERDSWKRNALAFAATADLFSLPERAADIIEAVAARRTQ